MAAKTPNEIRVNLDEANRRVEDNVAGADALRANGLAALQRIRTVKAARLDHERTRLTAKYGDHDPRVMAIGAQIDANAQLQRDLGIEADRSSVDVPKTDPNAWILLGHVRDAERHALPGLTVALFDKDSTWIKAAGYACTDAAGHFQLSLARDQKTKAQQSPAVFIHLSDSNQAVIYRDQAPMVADFGAISYREIIVSGQSCRPPGGTPMQGPQRGSAKPSAAARSRASRSSKPKA